MAQINNVILSIIKYFVQLKNAQDAGNISLFPENNDEDGAINWVKPHSEIIKVSVDGGFVEHDAFGAGIIARNSKGELCLLKHPDTGARWHPRWQKLWK